MQENVPSRTALSVALRRAGHQILDAHPRVLDDPLAVPIVGDAINQMRKQGRIGRQFRAYMVGRSRFMEDKLAEAVAAGARQYLILGAGLDTSAYRGVAATADIRVFEVDHPATQGWKLERLTAAGITVTANVRHVPVDFEVQNLATELNEAGFQRDCKTFVSWLGVIPYLKRDAASATFQFLGSLPPSSGVVFDYVVSNSALSLLERIAVAAVARRVANTGEPFQLSFEPAEMDEFLRERGFKQIEQLGSAEMNERYFRGRMDGLNIAGSAGRIVAAWT
jgi:methyltransferase (TIGR00027 family)